MNRTIRLSILFSAFATAVVLASNATAGGPALVGARADSGATGGSTGVEIPYLSHGVGITREASATLSKSTPIFRDTPDGFVPRGETVQVAATSGSSVDWNDVAVGLGFGLALAMLGALGLLAVQRTVRTQ